jgi:hypothetical protein
MKEAFKMAAVNTALQFFVKKPTFSVLKVLLMVSAAFAMVILHGDRSTRPAEYLMNILSKPTGTTGLLNDEVQEKQSRTPSPLSKNDTIGPLQNNE